MSGRVETGFELKTMMNYWLSQKLKLLGQKWFSHLINILPDTILWFQKWCRSRHYWWKSLTLRSSLIGLFYSLSLEMCNVVSLGIGTQVLVISLLGSAMEALSSSCVVRTSLFTATMNFECFCIILKFT